MKLPELPTITDLITSLVKQGITVRHDGTITWYHCKYCDRSGWISKSREYPLIHEHGCFVEMATKWLEKKDENNRNNRI